MIRTSYFAKYKDSDGVSIAVSAPRGFRGETYRPLTPPWHIVKQFNDDGDEVAYTKAYNHLLSGLDPAEVAADLDGKVLLCWEGKGCFCHRHLVAAWWRENLVIHVEEVV